MGYSQKYLGKTDLLKIDNETKVFKSLSKIFKFLHLMHCKTLARDLIYSILVP